MRYGEASPHPLISAISRLCRRPLPLPIATDLDFILPITHICAACCPSIPLGGDIAPAPSPSRCPTIATPRRTGAAPRRPLAACRRASPCHGCPSRCRPATRTALLRRSLPQRPRRRRRRTSRRRRSPRPRPPKGPRLPKGPRRPQRPSAARAAKGCSRCPSCARWSSTRRWRAPFAAAAEAAAAAVATCPGAAEARRVAETHHGEGALLRCYMQAHRPPEPPRATPPRVPAARCHPPGPPWMAPPAPAQL